MIQSYKLMIMVTRFYISNKISCKLFEIEKFDSHIERFRRIYLTTPDNRIKCNSKF